MPIPAILWLCSVVIEEWIPGAFAVVDEEEEVGRRLSQIVLPTAKAVEVNST